MRDALPLPGYVGCRQQADLAARHSIPVLDALATTSVVNE